MVNYITWKQSKTCPQGRKTVQRKLVFMNVLQLDSDGSRNPAGTSLKPINFYCAAPRARSVELVGDFNQWRPAPMQRSVDGWWRAQVQLGHGHHQYRFLVDGQPRLDPHAAGLARDEHDEHVSLIAVS